MKVQLIYASRISTVCINRLSIRHKGTVNFAIVNWHLLIYLFQWKKLILFYRHDEILGILTDPLKTEMFTPFQHFF